MNSPRGGDRKAGDHQSATERADAHGGQHSPALRANVENVAANTGKCDNGTMNSDASINQQPVRTVSLRQLNFQPSIIFCRSEPGCERFFRPRFRARSRIVQNVARK
jgi:hypothetical protein